MNLILSGKQLELTDGIRNAIEEKLGGIEQYFHPETQVKVTVSATKSRHAIEVTVFPINGPIIRAEDRQENLYAAIDIVHDKLYKQIRKYKTKMMNKHQDHRSIRFGNVEELGDFKDMDDDSYHNTDEEPMNIVIERRKKFDMKPMSSEEAVLQMELLGHEFYMFRNMDTDEISTVYRREIGGYGLIEHE